MKQNAKWVALIILATLFIVAITACKPAELAVDPTMIADAELVSALGSEELASFDTTAMEGAITTESGLQFVEIVAGEGDSPQDGDIVTMNFIASLPDGTEVGNSYGQGAPVVAIVGRDVLLPGWEEGLRLMKVGGKARMVLPPELAFGAEGYGMIPPDSVVLLEIEIISIEEPPIPAVVSQDDLTITESGLGYYDLKVGDGDEAEQGNIVTNQFILWVRGDLEDQYIGSSVGGQPITFELGKGETVFPGWEEGVINMKVGGKRLLVIPGELGFGETGAGNIPPNATLIMEIELVDVSEPVRMTQIDEADYNTTESGLRYFDMVEGVGPSPEAGQTVVVHYTGWLEDGTKFDSSLDRGQPFSFQLGTGNVIAGWDEGVSSMKVGGKRQLVIPAELGYGETGAGATIPPGATLIFEVELLEIQE